MVGLSLTLGLFKTKQKKQPKENCHMPLRTALYNRLKKKGKKLNNNFQMKTAMQLKRLHKAEKTELLLYITLKKKTCHTL